MRYTGNTKDSNGPGRTPIYKDWTVLQLGALVFLLDQFTKYLVRQLLPFGWSYPSDGFFRFTHVHNTGSAFGILQGLNTPLIFVSFIGIAILVLIYRSQPQPSNWLRLSLGLQLGGAFGNLLDRLRLGFVTDFIDVGPWPVFNLADASIVTGLVLLAWIFLRSERKQEPRTITGAAKDTAVHESYSWCPVCDGEMVEVTGGWHCIVCGVKERVDASGLTRDKSGVFLTVPPHLVQPLLERSTQSFVDGREKDSIGRPVDTKNDPVESPQGPADANDSEQPASPSEEEQRTYSETERP